MTNSSGRPYSPPLNITAQLELVLPSSELNLSWKAPLKVETKSSSKFKVSYEAFQRGQYKLHVQVDGSEINDSPFTLTAYPNPDQLNHPVKTVTGLDRPYDIAINKDGEMYVSEFNDHKVSIFDIKRQKIDRTLGSRSDLMIAPAGVTTDDKNNIYVSSQHELHKFNRSGKLVKSIGHLGKKNREFDDPRGVAIYDNQVYVTDRDNHRIQVFDLDLNFVRSIGSHGAGEGELDSPYDVEFDTAGNMYVAERDNRRVQVMDKNGKFIREFGHKVGGKRSRPSGLHIIDQYVYVSDWGLDCIVVYDSSGKCVTSFGRCGSKEGEFVDPRCITSCVNGFIYICDYHNNRVQIF